MTSKIITLTTDFGLRDPYVAEMKAVILNINPDSKIVDITHEIEKFNIRMGSYILAAASSFFPKGTIHVAVIDPSVGTRRQAILVQTENHYYIGPDNGVLALATESQVTERIYRIENPRFMLPKISYTFHGRDIFAPAAAYLAKGISPSEFGQEIQEVVRPRFAKTIQTKNSLTGEVIHVDGFGNIITNLREEDLETIGARSMINLQLRNTALELKLCRTYSEVGPQRALAIIGSHNFLEISINQGNAARCFKTSVGDKVKAYRSGSSL